MSHTILRRVKSLIRLSVAIRLRGGVPAGGLAVTDWLNGDRSGEAVERILAVLATGQPVRPDQDQGGRHFVLPRCP